MSDQHVDDVFKVVVGGVGMVLVQSKGDGVLCFWGGVGLGVQLLFVAEGVDMDGQTTWDFGVVLPDSFHESCFDVGLQLGVVFAGGVGCGCTGQSPCGAVPD